VIHTGLMANSYVAVERDQPFLMPPDMREWLPEDHLAWFVLDTVAALDTSMFHRGRVLGGVGRRGYDPDMLLALLIYAYANGQRSSRRIERLCMVDVACRVICGNLAPDHTAIARFRAEHDDAFKALFAMVLELCVGAGMGGLGTLAIDGTKIEANASRVSNRTREAIAAEVARVVDEAERADAAEDELLGDARGDELPAQWRGRNGRVERLRRALDQLDAETQQRLEESGTAKRVTRARVGLAEIRAQQQAKVAAFERAVAAGQRPRGKAPTPVDQYCWTRRAQQRLAAAEAAHAEAMKRATRTARGHARKANVTDPDSRLMRSKGAWVQAYNAQAAVAEDGVVVAAAVSHEVTDAALLLPMIDQAQRLTAAAGSDQRIGSVVADAGYWSNDNVIACAATEDHSPPLFIPPRDFNPRRDGDPAKPAPSDNASAAEKMRHRLSSPEGKAIYAKRSPQAEGPFGHLKSAFGFTKFSRRGHDAADSEWHFILAVRNLTMLHRRAVVAG
jgi:transposase